MRARALSEELLKAVGERRRLRLQWIERSPHRFHLVVHGVPGRAIRVKSDGRGVLAPYSRDVSSARNVHAYEFDTSTHPDEYGELVHVYHGSERPVAWFTVIRRGIAGDVIRHPNRSYADAGAGTSLLQARRPLDVRVMPDPSGNPAMARLMVRMPHPIDVARWGYPSVAAHETLATVQHFGTHTYPRLSQAERAIIGWTPDEREPDWASAVVPVGFYDMSYGRRHEGVEIDTPHRVAVEILPGGVARVHRTPRASIDAYMRTRRELNQAKGRGGVRR